MKLTVVTIENIYTYFTLLVLTVLVGMTLNNRALLIVAHCFISHEKILREVLNLCYGALKMFPRHGTYPW